MSTTTLAKGLGYAGLIPFAAALLATLLFNDEVKDFAELAFIFYSSVILSFLSGSLWGRLLSQNLDFKVGFLLFLTNLVAVSTWFSLLVTNWRAELSLFLLSAGFLSVFALEKMHTQLLYAGVVRGYLKLRGWLTLTVVSMHLAMFTLIA